MSRGLVALGGQGLGRGARPDEALRQLPGQGEIEIWPLFDMAKFAENLTPEVRGGVREKLSGKPDPPPWKFSDKFEL